jgi:group II intron reverse transcriptase/maturase
VASAAEGGEPRGLVEGSSGEPAGDRIQSRRALQEGLARVRQAIERDREQKLTALWHHVYDVARLREAYFNLKREAAAGVDGVTWQQYGKDLEGNLADLSARLKRGAYRAKPARRARVAKEDGRERLIGIPALEDKIAQRSAAEVLGTVWETEFKGFSYGFRPRRGQHDALDAVTVGIERRRISWILDADIRGFFDAIDREWLMKFIEHRIADRRVHRHVKKWLNAGVLEDGRRVCSAWGTPQGGSISPLLANIYLHYVLDQWADLWRKRQAHGDVIIVRYADDFIVGFQHREDAERFRAALEQRLGKFALELHPEKTRLIEFGRFAAANRAARGQGKPETFNFLGFTHICGKTQKGKFTVLRKTMKKRMRRSITRLKAELWRRMHRPIPETGQWLTQSLRGHYAYYGVPRNSHALQGYRDAVTRAWHRVLSRRSEQGYVRWDRMTRLARRWLPLPRITHPYPDQRLCVTT